MALAGLLRKRIKADGCRERVSPSKSVSAQEEKDGRKSKKKKGETFTLNIYLTVSLANSRYYGMRIKSQTE